jgi:hypothetical protein
MHSNKWFRGGAVAMIVVSTLALTVIIAAKEAELRALRPVSREIKRLRAMPAVGAYVPLLRTVSVAGDSLTIGETVLGRSQVLFAISTSCAICEAVRPTLERLADSLRTADHDVIWLSISGRDSTIAYRAKHQLRDPVVVLDDVRTTRLFGIKGVPLVLVVDAKGRVWHAHGSRFATTAAADSILVVARSARRGRLVPPTALDSPAGPG